MCHKVHRKPRLDLPHYRILGISLPFLSFQVKSLTAPIIAYLSPYDHIFTQLSQVSAGRVIPSYLVVPLQSLQIGW